MSNTSHRTTYIVVACASSGQPMENLRTFNDSGLAHAYAQIIRGEHFDVVNVLTEVHAR